MIELKKLAKYYGKILGCKNVSFKLKPGEIFGFIGPNGAGKSTAIRCIMNLINKTEGEIFISGEILDVKNLALKEQIGYLPSEINLYDDLTVQEIINYNNSFYQKDCMKKAHELIDLLQIDLSKKIEELSFGNTKKLGIILALMHNPKYIIMDEASNGLDPLMQEVFYKILQNEKEAGKTILFSSHNLSEVKRLADRIAIIKDGEIVALESTDKLTSSNSNIITIQTEQIKDLKKKIKGKILEEDHQQLKFIYEDDFNNLIKLLKDYPIKKLLIEEPSLEEIFMHYYV